MDLENLIKTLEYFFINYGYITVFVSNLLEMSPIGWLVPGGLALALAGFFANSQDSAVAILFILYGTFGSLVAFLISYLLGKKTGNWLIKKLKQEKNAAFAKRLLLNHGSIILTTSMMANMTRFWVAYIAGIESYPIFKFIKFAFVASFGWTSLLVAVGYIAGYEKDNLKYAIRSVGILGWVIFVLVVIVIYISIKHEYKHFKEDDPHNENN
jgi:membrane protein DedA with SNARE-associated domain